MKDEREKRAREDAEGCSFLFYLIVAYVANYHLLHWAFSMSKVRPDPYGDRVCFALLWLLSPVMFPFFLLFWVVVEVIGPALYWLGDLLL